MHQLGAVKANGMKAYKKADSYHGKCRALTKIPAVAFPNYTRLGKRFFLMFHNSIILPKWTLTGNQEGCSHFSPNMAYSH